MNLTVLETAPITFTNVQKCFDIVKMIVTIFFQMTNLSLKIAFTELS